MRPDVDRDRLETAVLNWMESCSEPARWGVDDCALSFANIVNEALGYDPAASIRGRYTNRQEALQIGGRGGLGFAFRALAKDHGWKRIEPAQSRVGDPGLCMISFSPNDNRVVTTIARGAHGIFLVRTEDGFATLPPDQIRLCWSLG